MKFGFVIFSVLLVAICIPIMAGCNGSFSCNGKQFGENCTYNGSAGYCESSTGYCLLACSGPEGSCAGAGSGAACYWLTGYEFVCRGAGDPRSPGDGCNGKITDCGDKYWCLSAGDAGASCQIPCRNNDDCSNQLGTVCSNVSDGGGLQICVPLIP
jgi:hypothetical protein